jgi:hypothetical protein
MIGSSISITNFSTINRKRKSNGIPSDPVLMYNKEYVTWNGEQLTWNQNEIFGDNLTFKGQDVTFLSQLLTW